VALERFALLSQVQELLHQGVPLAVALSQVCCGPITRPDGTQRLVARRTLEDWWYAYQHGGFAALHPKRRSDRGVSRVITAEQRQFFLQQVQTHLAVPVEVLYRRWKQSESNLPSLASIYRLLRAHQLDAPSRRRQWQQPLGGATKAFETPAVNELWMADFSPGPFLRPPNASKPIATHLCLIVDDHSRLVPYAAYGLKADTQAFPETLKQAVRRRGLPLRLYTDQGGPFTNDHTRVVCARLGIRLLHAKPYHAWSKELVSYCTRYELFSVLHFPPVPALSGFDFRDDRLRGSLVKVITSVAEPTSCQQADFSPIVDEV
jgi:putative transposase